MSKVYFCADTHFFHQSICKYRKNTSMAYKEDGQWRVPEFTDREEHDEVITQQICETAGKRDTLWILGDVCFSSEGLVYLERIKQRVGRLKLILGNHDIEASFFKDVADEVHGFRSYKGFWLSHAPIHPDEMRGKLGNIYGHSHGFVLDNPQYQCVSMEKLSSHKPICFDEIKERFTND